MTTQIDLAPKEIPDSFFCPLTLEVMSDPLMSKHGHNYERKAILKWLTNRNGACCPITRMQLTPAMLIPNNALRLKIRAWQSANDMEITCAYSRTKSSELFPTSCCYDEEEVVSTVFTLHDEGQIHKIRRQSSEGMASRSRGGRRRNILSGLARKFRNAAC